MNQAEKCSLSGARQHQVFHVIFLFGMMVSLWIQWGPQSAVVWDTNCVVAFTLAVTQLALYAGRALLTWRCEPKSKWAEVVFFVVNFAICLAEFRCGVPYYSWIFWVLLGYMLVVLPRRYSVPIGILATALYVPMLAGWERVGAMTLRNWFGELYSLAFPWFLGLFYRRLLDSNDERARLIDELEAAKKELEAARDREGELATLRERERVARELHDTLGHQLVTLTVQLEAAHRLLTVDPVRVRGQLEEMQKLSRASMTDLRRALDNLRTTGHGEGPLTEALQRLCTETGRNLALPVDWELAPGANALPAVVGEALWRVAQEGLTNISRHARARKVSVQLSLQSKEVVLRVTDDGVGVPIDAEKKPGHYGLRGLRERVEGLGGTFTLATVPGGGTMMEARLPLIA